MITGCKKILIFLLAAPVFAQNPVQDRNQGLVTSEPVWRQALGGAVTALPSVQAQSAVVTLDGGNIRAYSTSGRPLWSYFSGGRLSPYVSRSREGTSYISRTNGTLIAINRSGRELWRVNPGGQLSGHVIAGWDGRLFVPTGSRLSCYTSSGNLLWVNNFENPISISPQLDQGGGIILALENNEVLHIDPFGRMHSWGLSAKPLIILSLIPTTGEAGEKFPRIMALFQDGTIEILSEAGEWFIPAQAGASSRPMPRLPARPAAAGSWGNNAAVALTDGRTLLFSADRMETLWTGDSHIRLTNSGGNETEVVYDERGVYVLSRNGATCFTAEGRRLWYTLLTNAAAIPAFGDDGVLYSGSQDWILNAYKLEDRILPVKLALYGPAPEGTYGTGNPPRSPWAEFPMLFSENQIMDRLNSMGSDIRAGRVGTNELAWTAWLMETSGLSRSAQEIRSRITALGLLGHIGSRETIPWLTNLFNRETDAAVKAAAASAIGAIGVDPEGIAIRAFLDTVSYSSSPQDEQFLASVAAATGALCRFSGPPLSDAGVRILTMLSADTRSPAVRRQARTELASLGLR
ncbi:MAG: PQQ-binding-like beta-propeller repeat protein [Treponema sp.]|nr:PQQ-binding-like beta-propeller repeat protein [Treponema sp.]